MKTLAVALLVVGVGCRTADRFHALDMAHAVERADLATSMPKPDMVVVAAVDLAATTSADMAQVSQGDLATTIISDMALSCANQGQVCTVGVGACARSGVVACTAQGTGACDAVAGAPDTSGTWHQATATNGSWDWDCDGAIEFQYPSGDTTPPPLETSSGYVSCDQVAVQSVCVAPHWFYYLNNHWALSCGHEVDDNVCTWSTGSTGSSCIAVGTTPTTQGCR